MDVLPLHTERLTLRLTTERDLDALLSYYGNTEVCRYLPFGPWTDDVETLRRRLERRVERTGVDGPARALALLIEHHGRVVGNIALWATDDTGAVGEICWVLHPDAAGQGFASEAASAVLDLAIGHYGMHRVVARMDARNTASARVCERLGMTHEGVLRQELWHSGEWADAFIHAVLAQDRPVRRSRTITVSAVTLRDADGRVLTVRKRGTSRYMQPGGKPEPGESAARCVLREVQEELGLELDPSRLQLLGVRCTEAANEAGHRLVATVFTHPALSTSSMPHVEPAAEIDSVRWLDPAEPLPDDIAPLLRQVVTELTSG